MTDPIDRRVMLGAAGLLGAAALSRVASAGPLNPPPGPITPTGKTLTEVEPRTAISDVSTPGNAGSIFRITQPGSYYLTGNLAGQAGKHGIVIAADDVTVDLMGFAVRGVTSSLSGIHGEGFRRRITIRAGVVTGWGEHGIDVGTVASGRGMLVELIHSTNNGQYGICAPSQSVLRDCIASTNLAGGVYTEDSAVIVNCAASSNTGNGFEVGGSSGVERCIAVGNTAAGFTAAAGSHITGCNARFNGTRGIWLAGNDCTARDNTCSSNGFSTSGDGIYANATACLIEGNHCTTNGRGIRVITPGNFIARNRCSGNATANWDIAANNKCLVVNGVNTSAFSGNAGGASPGSTDPNANFTY